MIQETHNWTHYLHRDEELLWQGRPATRPTLTSKDIFFSLFGSIFIFSGAFAMSMSLGEGPAGLIGFFIGIVHFSVGSYIAIGRHLLAARKHKTLSYALTSRRALILADQKLQSIGIDKSSTFEIEHHTSSDSIYFDTDDSTTNFQFSSSSGRSRKKAGFKNIADGKNVYKMLLDIQSENT